MSQRYAVLVPFVLLSLVSLALPAFGGIPDPWHSTAPRNLVACPAGDVTYTVVVHDIADNPVGGCQVDLRFDNCPSFDLCAGCCTGLTVDWQNRRISMLSDATGTARFPLKMGGVCAGATVGVYACGVQLALVYLASPDQNGNLTVGGDDAATVHDLIGTMEPRADFDGDWYVTQADLDWLANYHGGHSCTNVVPARTPTWGSIKLLYR